MTTAAAAALAPARPGPAIPGCTGCGGGPLVAIQPHPRRPDRVYGFCWECGELYRLEPGPRGAWRVAGPAPLAGPAGA